MLEFQHKEIFKNYTEYLYSEKKDFSLQNKKSTEFIFKILMNSFYGSILTDKTRFRDIRICTTKRQSLKFTKLPNFHNYKIINENLIIIELSKNKCIFDSPIMIGSEVLFNSKCNLYNYMYNIIPILFRKENITYSFRDTDSITYKIKICSHEKYLKILKDNPQYYSKNLEVMENVIDENIEEVTSLRSKSYSLKMVNNENKSKSKGISKNYCKVNHNHEYFKKILFNEKKTKKAEYYKISLKDGKLQTELQIKNDISSFNDKRYMIDNLTSNPLEINL